MKHTPSPFVVNAQRRAKGLLEPATPERTGVSSGNLHFRLARVVTRRNAVFYGSQCDHAKTCVCDVWIEEGFLLRCDGKADEAKIEVLDQMVTVFTPKAYCNVCWSIAS
jgi:hypothetical protein